MPSPAPLVTRLESSVRQMQQIADGAALVQIIILAENALALLPEEAADAMLADFQRQADWMTAEKHREVA